MGELNTGPNHPLSSADPESYFDLHVIAPGYQPEGKGDCGCLVYSRQVEFVSLGRMSTYESGTLTSTFKPIVRGPCWHCPRLLGHVS